MNAVISIFITFYNATIPCPLDFTVKGVLMRCTLSNTFGDIVSLPMCYSEER